MATLVSTALARRSGGTTTFAPLGVYGGVGQLAESATFQRLSPQLTMSAKRTSGGRRISQVRFAIPQVDVTDAANPVLIRTGFVDVIITVPDGYPSANVNDLVGYVEKGTATAVTNLNALLVSGEGVY